jgi:hypothetical protein
LIIKIEIGSYLLEIRAVMLMKRRKQRRFVEKTQLDRRNMEKRHQK